MSKSANPTIRALFDTNVFISYLLPSKQGSAIHAIMEAAFEGSFTLLMAQEIAEEFSRKVESKKYLAQRISGEEAEQLVQAILAVAEIIPAVSSKLPVVTRDAKDDYLLSYALIGQADYLVTGDEDLLILKEVEGIKIVSPAQFEKVLKP